MLDKTSTRVRQITDHVACVATKYAPSFYKSYLDLIDLIIDKKILLANVKKYIHFKVPITIIFSTI